MSGAPVGGAAVIRVPVLLLRREKSAWPRRGLEHERVQEFLRLYLDVGVESLPLIEVFADVNDYVIADGNHRLEAILQTDLVEIDVALLPTTGGRDVIVAAFERGLATSARSSLPLTRSEKHDAIRHLKSSRSDLSNHQIAELVGCSHQTVGRILGRSNGPVEEPTSAETASPQEIAIVSAYDVAKQLFLAIDGVYRARGLGVWDALTRDHTGERLALVLEQAFGDDALDRATQFGIWCDEATEILEGRRA